MAEREAPTFRQLPSVPWRALGSFFFFFKSFFCPFIDYACLLVCLFACLGGRVGWLVGWLLWW